MLGLWIVAQAPRDMTDFVDIHAAQMSELKHIDAAFIGSAGVPNRYGGFEAFLEFCGPQISERIRTLQVTCDASLYPDKSTIYKGMIRKFIRIRANGPASVLHDLVAFFQVFPQASHIVILGVSGGPWFPMFRLLCSLTGKRLLVNVDGVEWRRGKFNLTMRLLLRIFDWLAQSCAHVVIYDNAGLKEHVLPRARSKAVEIAYPGDHVLRSIDIPKEPYTALTICRIEPENQLELMIEGFLASSLKKYTIVGNWNNSKFSKTLRARYRHEKRLKLLDPIYDPILLGEVRERCQFYLHGHSVGGTNPSLVEMMFYECYVFCFDVNYNRFTAGSAAIYFSDAPTLSQSIESAIRELNRNGVQKRYAQSMKYTRAFIADSYLSALES